jgi:hypothetical protein
MEEKALTVLRMLLAKGCAPEREITVEVLADWLDDAGLEENDFLLGLAKAAVQGWVVSKNDGSFSVTPAGAAAVRGLH